MNDKLDHIESYVEYYRQMLLSVQSQLRKHEAALKAMAENESFLLEACRFLNRVDAIALVRTVKDVRLQEAKAFIDNLNDQRK